MLKAFQGDHHLTTNILGGRGRILHPVRGRMKAAEEGPEMTVLNTGRGWAIFLLRSMGAKLGPNGRKVQRGRASLRCREESPNKYGHLPMSFMKTKHTTHSHYQHNVFEDPFISNKIGKRWILRTQNTLEGTY